MSISSSSATSTSRIKNSGQASCMSVSQLINYFISAANTNTIIAVVTGKRKREIGLVVPAKYFAYTNNKKNAEMLMKKLLEKKMFSNSLYTTKILLKDLVYFNL